MEPVHELFSGSGAFALTFVVSLALLAAFITLYSLLTSHREMALIRTGNKAAALSLGGAILGFVIPVGKAVAQSTNLIDLVVWAAIAFVAQIARVRGRVCPGAAFAARRSPTITSRAAFFWPRSRWRSAC